jgi:hypothetical protein
MLKLDAAALSVADLVGIEREMSFMGWRGEWDSGHQVRLLTEFSWPELKKTSPGTANGAQSASVR